MLNTNSLSQTHRHCCRNTAVNSTTLGMCPNTTVTPVIAVGNPFIKVPVVLAEITVQANLEATITLKHAAVDIKRITKNVFLTQCELLKVPAVEPYTQTSFKLFLSGFVRKNIEYSTLGCVGTNGAVSGRIRHTTVDIPFSCMTILPPGDFLSPPIFNFNSMRQAEIYDPNVSGRAAGEQIFQQVEIFNEKIFCELLTARITELDKAVDLTAVPGTRESTFRNIKEKISLDLTLKLLQNQQLSVASPPDFVGIAVYKE